MFKVPIIEDFIPKGRKNRPGIIVPKRYCTIHITDNFNRGADAISHGNYLKRTAAAQKPVSWAYTVDDKRIVKHLPIGEVAYHAGDGYNGTGNRESIGVEICCHKGIDQAKAYRNAAWLVAHLQAEVPTLLPFPENIRPGNIAGGVAQHNRWNGKNCPSLLRKTPNGWTDFLEQVEEFLESEKMDVSLPYFKFLDIMATAPPPIPYGVKMIAAELEWPETKGKGVKVCALDTGKPNHPDIKVAGAVDFTGTGLDDKHGHSTHVCGIIAANGKIKGVAPECELYSAKVLNDKGQGSYVWVTQAVRWCIENKMDVISMSLGGSKPADDTLHSALRDAYAAGITIVVAAGNLGEFGKDTVLYPAVYEECLATTAVDMEKKRPEFSSQ
ncbi:MAG: S8 family serine peptidase, partial [Thermodesulfobacteriota bacterium]|nr:S8 family serine peptidase [Thermodesulfobacteriota bacterium]